jgi:hypothetical protein
MNTTEWQQKIEAQIARASDYKQCDRDGVFCQLSRQAQDELLVSVKALLDVAIAADDLKWGEGDPNLEKSAKARLRNALDKLREVGDG